jgi:hypothetical protein
MDLVSLISLMNICLLWDFFIIDMFKDRVEMVGKICLISIL